MTKSQIIKLGIGTRSHVLAHGKRQRQKGKNPSAHYKGVRNPIMALDLARHEEEVLSSLGDG